ncbi:hypothetical protein SAY86_000060 [Trapa natans]|uniref:Mitochondrial import inner membrane translocase subunit TIM50 n=1 Tax=Trapa natans TaxID=22666 RepID=A0AAN7RFF0_TRANT|nr:hypothetical protein SAY86_000060 [Trapa natans]
MLSSEALKPVKVHLIKAGAKERGLKGSNDSITFLMTKSNSGADFDVDSLLHSPQVSFQKPGSGVVRCLYRMRLSLHSKSSSQNSTTKRPNALLGSISSHQMLVENGQSNFTEMDLLLNLSLSGENCLLSHNHKLYHEHLTPDFRLYHQKSLDAPISYSNRVEQMLPVPETFRELARDRFYSPPRRTLGGLGKKLLILDINGLLADIVSPPPKEFKADIKFARRAVFKRPFCMDFMNFCFERFDVGIWSSRARKNIEKVIDHLMGDLKHKLLFCWDLSHCTPTRFHTLENRHKSLVFKEVRRIWEKYDPNLPWERGYYNESNTLLLDDSPYKALLNPPHTAIFPRSFNFQNKGDTSLGHGGDLRVYLDELAAATNVQKYVAQHPFGQRAITERSSSWGFYLRVLNSVTRRHNISLSPHPCLRC